MANESSQILTISSTIKEALAFIESVKSLAASREEGSAVVSASSVPLTVPWTITNKYYVADVHFSVWTMDRVFVELFERESAALVFVWSEGEPYVKHVNEIARLMKLREYEPEVALAVRIPSIEMEAETKGDKDGCGEDEVENGDIDGMLMSLGFEYVDATRTVEAEKQDDDIPGLPRVVDALSTIIWPTMRSNKVEGVGGLKATSLDLNEEGGDEDEDEELEKERESMLQELLREIKDEDEEKPWISVSPERMSPTEMSDGDDEQVSLRFEDDFSTFVSGADGYRALGSVSDFGENDADDGGFDLDEVFGVLQGYKTEIAGMGSEEERRASAARVALGLVYDNYLHNS